MKFYIKNSLIISILIAVVFAVPVFAGLSQRIDAIVDSQAQGKVKISVQIRDPETAQLFTAETAQWLRFPPLI